MGKVCSSLSHDGDDDSGNDEYTNLLQSLLCFLALSLYLIILHLLTTIPYRATNHRQVIYADFLVMEALILLGSAVSEDFTAYYEKRRDELATLEKGIISNEEATEEQTQKLYRNEDPPTAIKEELMITYETALNTSAGNAIRLDMLRCVF